MLPPGAEGPLSSSPTLTHRPLSQCLVALLAPPPPPLIARSSSAINPRLYLQKIQIKQLK